ncbi:MAG: type II toxin-antitoxin system VapC family toxin [Candidatus Aenigmarchaeota archaeon]|nr:type II toxin-antitoxin system VapC family toxin [Candidatus Aenigmarchaeota archaeon]
MKFIDTNVFLHAFLQPKGKLTEVERYVKQNAKNIIRRIENGEKTITSAVHISEVSNVLESRSSNKVAREIIESIILNENITIAEVNKNIYISSIEFAKIHDININDCAAVTIMKLSNTKEIYSFDSDFDKIEGIERIEK